MKSVPVFKLKHTLSMPPTAHTPAHTPAYTPAHKTVERAVATRDELSQEVSDDQVKEADP